MPTAEGRFVVLEGIDGSGTTTQTELLAEHLRRQGRRVVTTCEPTDGRVGALIRSFLSEPDRPRHWATMALLFAADRLDHVENTVLPAIAEGAVVISDRYDLSSLAYQSATSDTSAEVVPWIRELNRFAPRPDLTVVLDVNPAVAEQRRRSRGGPSELFEKTELQRRLAELYRRADELVAGDRLSVLPADGSPAEVAEAVARVVDALR